MNRYKFLNENDEHLHTLDGRPLIGTSTVLKVLSKPLTYWAAGLAVAELGWIKELKPWDKPRPTKEAIEKNGVARFNAAFRAQEKIKGMDALDFLALLDKAYKAHATNLKTTAGVGTDMHAELEKYVKTCIAEHGGVPQLPDVEYKAVAIFALWAKENVKRFIASEAHCYSEALWTGGIVDLVYEDLTGKLVIMDFKSSKDAYLSQFFQDAGYDIAISENGVLDKDGNLITKLERSIDAYAVFPFGMEKPEPQFHFDTKGAQEGFKAAVVLHRLLNQN